MNIPSESYILCFLIHSPPDFDQYVIQTECPLLAEMEPAFVEYMEPFIEDLLRPSNLKAKRVNRKYLTVRDFLVFVKLYVGEMHSDKLPTPETLYDATVKATNSAVVNSCFDLYQARVAELILNDPKEPARFEETHDSVLTEVFTHFNQSTKMGCQSIIRRSEGDLNMRIAASKQHFQYANSAAYDKKQFEAQTKALLGEQGALRSQINDLCDQSGNLGRRLAKAEAEKLRVMEEARNATAENKRQFEAKAAAILNDQKNMQSEMQKLGESTRALHGKLEASEAEKKRIMAEAKKSHEEMAAALKEAKNRRRGFCTIS